MMELVFELPDRAALVEYLQDKYAFIGPTEENIRVRQYMFDERNQWDTYLVTVDGSAVLFCDGPVHAD
jgi:rubrerythrin